MGWKTKIWGPEPEKETSATRKLNRSLAKNMEFLQGDFGDTMDFLLRETNLNGGRKGAFVLCDGLCSSMPLGQMIVNPILNKFQPMDSPDAEFDAVRDSIVATVEQSVVTTVEDAEYFIMSGFAVFLLDGVDRGLAMGIQGWAKRGIDEPSTEAMSMGAKEGFIENLTDNVGLMRRKVKSPLLQFEMIKMGQVSSTRVAICYRKDRVDPDMLRQVRKKLEKIPLKEVLDFGYIKPFLEEKRHSLFSGVGTTERPDTLCAKISEGRIGVMVDGTPFALITPYLFTENFQSFDDYDHAPYYAGFIRILKYFSFFISLFLPGLYVAVGSFHPELFPGTLMYDIAASEQRTPLPLMAEGLMVLVLYEIMREAGLRLPKNIGHAVSIIGGIVIGDATVSAGLIGAPMLIVVALTAISSYVVYPLYEPVSMLRLLFLVVGGLTGLYGIMLGGALLLLNACSLQPLGVPYTAPLSPFSLRAMRDVFVRAGWRLLDRGNFRVSRMKEIARGKGKKRHD